MVMVEELIRMMREHAEIDNSHREFYELAEKYGFCTPWCHTNNCCEICEKRCIVECSTE